MEIPPAQAGRQRAVLLLQHDRPALAEEELRRALNDDPLDARLHALLALAIAQDPARMEEAVLVARIGVAAGPEDPFPQHALSRVLVRAGRWGEAERAAREAVRLAPDRADFLAPLAALLLDTMRPGEGLSVACHGLEADPEHVECGVLRASALSQLGKHRAADEALARVRTLDPSYPRTHTTVGWAALRRGRVKEAEEAFREALRLDPTLLPARTGLMEAVKARSPLYRPYLRGRLRFPWLPPMMKMVAVVVGMLAVLWVPLAIHEIGPLRPLRPLARPLQGAIVVAVLLVWTALPMHDLLLLRDPGTRAGLTPLRVRVGWATLALVALTLGLAVSWELDGPSGSGMAALMAGALTIPVTAFNHTRPGPNRTLLAVALVLLVALAALALRVHVGGGNAGALVGLLVGGIFMADFFEIFLPARVVAWLERRSPKR